MWLVHTLLSLPCLERRPIRLAYEEGKKLADELLDEDEQ
jgi:hypothetical protein